MGVSVLAEAEERAPKSKPRNKSTVWILAPEDPLGETVAELHKLGDEAEAIKGRLDVAKAALAEFAESQFVTSIKLNGTLPDSPIVIQNDAGLKVNFVVRDCTTSAALKLNQVEALGELLGVDAAAELLDQVTTFSLNQKILAIPGVRPIVEKALSGAINRLIKDQILTWNQAEELLEAEKKIIFRPGLLARLVSVVPKRKLASFVAAIGPSLTRFIKA